MVFFSSEIKKKIYVVLAIFIIEKKMEHIIFLWIQIPTTIRCGATLLDILQVFKIFHLITIKNVFNLILKNNY